jgi:hypothetical protein
MPGEDVIAFFLKRRRCSEDLRIMNPGGSIGSVGNNGASCVFGGGLRERFAHGFARMNTK